MTDQAPAATTTFPPIVTTMLQSLGQHAGTAIAGALVTYGVVQSSRSTEVVDVVSAIVVGGAGLLWTYIMHRAHARKAASIAASNKAGQ